MNNYNKLLDKHYKYLLKISSNCTNKYKYRDNNIHYAVLNEVIINVSKNINKNKSFMKSDDDFLKYMTGYIRNYTNWYIKNLNFKGTDNKLFTANNTKIDEYYMNNYNEEYDDIQQRKNEIDFEMINKNEKEFLKQLIQEDISIERGILYNDVLLFVSKQSLEEQILFELKYLKKMTIKEIHSTIQSKCDFKFPMFLITDKLKKLKLKIKNEFYNDTIIDSIS